MSRRTPPHQPKTTLGVGRPSRPRRADPAASDEATRPPPGHRGHHPALAPASRTEEVDLPEPARTTTDQRRPRLTGCADGAGKPELGLPQNPGRAAQTRPPRRRLDGPPDPAPPPDPTGTVSTDRHQLAAVPAYAGRQHVGRGLLPRRLRCGGSTFCSRSRSATATCTSWV
jgi:hypothetical protein